MKALAHCPGCLTDEVSPSKPVCATCLRAEAAAPTHEPGCICDIHDVASRVAKWRRREARRARSLPVGAIGGAL